MTEDDTFLALRKPSYAEMYQLWASSELLSTRGVTDYKSHQEKIKAFFAQYGWDVMEYSMQAWPERNQ